MVVGHYIAVLSDDDTGTAPLLFTLLGQLVAEEEAHDRVVVILHGTLDRNLHENHRIYGRFGGIGKVGPVVL